MRGVRTEIMRNRFAAIVEEAAVIVYRTAHTTFVKQTQDYQCALATLDGELFAYPRFSGVTSFAGLSLKATIDAVGLDKMRPGDVVITNDPFESQGMCTHTMDLHVLRPIFDGDTLLCFAWAFLHASDIGGAVPGSISPAHTEVFQEGLRLRAVKLYRGGELNRELLYIIQDNCRIPDQIWGDIKAMCAAMATMDRRCGELCRRYGAAELRAGIADVLCYAETKARAVISALPDGSWEFSDQIEAVRGERIVVRCRMTISGDTMELDFSGSSGQVAAACNFVTGDRTHPFLCRALMYYVLTLEPDTPLNGAVLRPIHAHAPRGSVMNANFPAAMGNRAVTFMRIYDVVLGCLDQALPEGLSAAGASQAGIILAAVTDPDTLRQIVGVVEPLIGGSGGRRNMDGSHGIDTPVSFLRSTPIELVELELPLLVHRYGLVPDSCGAGRFRGGAAVAIELECLAETMTMTVRGCDRLTVLPWGVRGGHPGHPGYAALNGRDIGLVEVLKLVRQDRVQLASPSGAGFGDPRTRDPAAVELDVRDGTLSERAAREIYGVAVGS